MSENLLKFFNDIDLKPRKSQEDLINFISKNINKKYFIIEAPTGSGKSHTALALSNDYKIYICTNSKFLQDQYLSLYSNMVLLKGKSNYSCGLNKKLNCEIGYCSSFPNVKSTCIKKKICPYYNQLEAAINSNIVIMNYDYLLYAIHCGSFSKNVIHTDEEFNKKIFRDFLICDEAHLLEDKIISFVEFTLNLNEISKKYNINFDNINFTDNENKNIDLLEKINYSITIRCKQYKAIIDDILEKYQDEIFSIFHDNSNFELSKDDKNELSRLHNIFYSLDKINQKINVFFENFKNNKWIIKNISNKELFLSPYKASGLFDNYIGKISKRFILMSATIGDANEFIKEFGLMESITISKSLDSEFDSEQSPIIYSPIGKMNYKEIDITLPNISTAINKIITEFHPDEKGIIHTTNYKIAEYIYKNIKSDRFIYGRPTDNDRLTNKELFDLHESSKKPSVLISPSLHEGISLDDDLSRFQIIIKLPFLNISNLRTKIKMNDDSDWYAFKMWINLMQASGRSTRSIEDFSVTYILDSSFEYFYNKYKSKLPKWFKDRIIF